MMNLIIGMTFVYSGTERVHIITKLSEKSVYSRFENNIKGTESRMSRKTFEEKCELV